MKYARGVPDIDADRFFPGSRITELLEGRQRGAAAAARVDDQIGLEIDLRRVGPQAFQAHTRDATSPPLAQQALQHVAGQQANVRGFEQAPAQAMLEQRPALCVNVESAGVAKLPDAVVIPAHVAAVVEDSAAGGREFLRDTGEQALDDPHPAGPEQVDVVALRHALASADALVAGVPLDDGHRVEMTGEDSRREQSRDACSDHDGVT